MPTKPFAFFSYLKMYFHYLCNEERKINPQNPIDIAQILSVYQK